MHELSLVASIVDAVTESLGPYPGARVKEVRLRVGALAAVEEESLQFCYGVATDDTPLAGSKLVVKIVPVGGHCPSCARDVEIASLRSFRCPLCGGPVENTVQGRELEIESIEIEDAEEETVQS
jgi:hydrogenase nickel incorporation protein HypA/HybF